MAKPDTSIRRAHRLTPKCRFHRQKRALASGFLLVAEVAASGLPAAAHDWYTGLANKYGELCCGGEDCTALANPRVRRTYGGYDVDIVPGTHPMVRTNDWWECYYGGAYCTEFVGMHTCAAVTFHFDCMPGVSPDGSAQVCIDGVDLTKRRIRCLFLGGVS